MAAAPDDAALAVVKAYCRWPIEQTTEEITVAGSGGYVQMLPTMHVTDVASVVNDGTTLVEGTDYDWHPDGWLESLSSSFVFSSRPRGVVVTLTHGYDELPEDVQQVVDRLMVRGAHDPGGLQQAGPVGYATTSAGVAVGSALSSFDKSQLAPYRRPLVS